MTKKSSLIVIVMLVVLYVIWSMMRPTPEDVIASTGMVDVTLPESLTTEAEVGKAIFEENCAICHGENASGVDGSGPPLVHKIYEPSHHGDESFQRAVALGVRGHHWRFGDMSPVEGIDRTDVEQIISYVRALQRANGIN